MCYTRTSGTVTATTAQWDRIRGIAGPDPDVTHTDLGASMRLTRANLEASMRVTPALTQAGPPHSIFRIAPHTPIGATPLVCDDISGIIFAGRGHFMVIEGMRMASYPDYSGNEHPSYSTGMVKKLKKLPCPVSLVLAPDIQRPQRSKP